MSELRAAVRDAMQLRAEPGWVAQDRRPRCEGCGRQVSVLITISVAVLRRLVEWQECVRCWAR